MKIKSVILKDFRSYKYIKIDFNDLTVFVGKNDVGKSTILEALDLFFNEGKGTIKLDSHDKNIYSDTSEFEISVTFNDLPSEIVIDDSCITSLGDEYLLNKDNNLEVTKKFSNAKCKETLIKAYYPSVKGCNDLYAKKQNELKKIIDDNNISCSDKRSNPMMRKAIWEHFSKEKDLEQECIEINVSSCSEDVKNIWDRVKNYLPSYFLFQSDRKNEEGDREIQDPLNYVVKEFFKDDSIIKILDNIAYRVTEKLRDVSSRTLAKLQEMDQEVAKSLEPTIPSAKDLKWWDVFKNVSITSDEQIPINKRGSGVKRLVLFNFFRAEAERKIEGKNYKYEAGVIYAIEEPETSQHYRNQVILTKALIELSKKAHTQVIMTTHSGTVVKQIGLENIRIIFNSPNGKVVEKPKNSALDRISMSEINYLILDEVTDEYHNELYGYIFENNLLQEYKKGKKSIDYKRQCKDGSIKHETSFLSKYIRDVYHHPENNNNRKYTEEELKESIELMRDFILSKKEKQNK